MARIDGKFIQSDFIDETPTGTVNGSNTAFTLSSTPVTGTVAVYIDGLKDTAFSVTGTSLTMTTAPANAQTIRVTYLKRN